MLIAVVSLLSPVHAGACDAGNPLPCPPQSVLDEVAEACEYRVVFDLSPAVDNRYLGADPGYSADHSAHGESFDRIAYYVEVDRGAGPEWAWVSMDAFTTSLPSLGVPDAARNPAEFHQNVANMNVASNMPGVVEGNGFTTGNVEIWPSCYQTFNFFSVPFGSHSLYDHGDTRDALGNCYGSFQVHNHGAPAHTVFGWNEFQNVINGPGDDFTIGNSTGTHPDGTYGNGFTGTVSRRIVMMARFPSASCEPEVPPLLDCTGLDAQVCGYVNELGAAVNGEVGSALVDEGSAVPRFRPSTIYSQLISLRNVASSQGCVTDGWAGGAYNISTQDLLGVSAATAESFVGGWGDGDGPLGDASGTCSLSPRGFVGAYDGAATGTIGDVFRKFNQDGRLSSNRDDAFGFLAGRWIRITNKHGVWATLTGTCTNPARPSIDPWYGPN